MGSVVTLLSAAIAFVISHLAGEFLGTVLARIGIAGFGGRAAKVMRVGRALAKLVRATRGTDQEPAARQQLKAWLEKHDPDRKTGLHRVLDEQESQSQTKE